MKVVVVGAGILGSITAYDLAREGCEVALVDRADEGRATAAGAGIVCPWGSSIEDASSYALLTRGARYHSQIVAMLAEDGECDLGYAQVGGLYVPTDPSELGEVERRLHARTADAPEAGRIDRLSSAEAGGLFPPLRPNQPAVLVPAVLVSMANVSPPHCGAPPPSVEPGSSPPPPSSSCVATGPWACVSMAS